MDMRKAIVFMILTVFVASALLVDVASEPVYSYAAVVRKYFVPNNATLGLRSLSAGPDGSVWFVESSVSKVGRVVSRNRTMVEWQLPDSNSTWDVLAEDASSVWISQTHPGRIIMLNPKQSTIRVYSFSATHIHPAGIAIDGVGRVWFVDPVSGSIGYLNRSSGTAYIYSNSSASDRLKGSQWISVYGNLVYVSDPDENVVWELNATSGILRAYRIPVDYSVGFRGLDVSRNGTVWLAEHRSTHITEFAPSSSCLNGTYEETVSEAGSVMYTSAVSETTRTISYTEEVGGFTERSVSYTAAGCFKQWGVAMGEPEPAAVSVDGDYVWFVEGNKSVLGVLNPPEMKMGSIDLGISGALYIAVHSEPSFRSIWLMSKDGGLVEVAICLGATQTTMTVTETQTNMSTVTVNHTVTETTTETTTETVTETATTTRTSTKTTTKTITRTTTKTKLFTTTKTTTKTVSKIPDVYYLDFAVGVIGAFLIGFALSYTYAKKSLKPSAGPTEKQEKPSKPS